MEWRSQDRRTDARPPTTSTPGKSPPCSHGACCKPGAAGALRGSQLQSLTGYTSPTALHGWTDGHAEMPLAWQIRRAAPGVPGRQVPSQDQLTNEPQLKAAAWDQGWSNHKTSTFLAIEISNLNPSPSRAMPQVRGHPVARSSWEH